MGCRIGIANGVAFGVAFGIATRALLKFGTVARIAIRFTKWRQFRGYINPIERYNAYSVQGTA